MLCSAGQLHEVENMRLWYPRCTLGISPKRIPFISEVRVAYCGETANSENQKITVKCWKSTWHIQFVCYCTDKVLIQALTNLGHKENRFAGWHPICSVFVFFLNLRAAIYFPLHINVSREYSWKVIKCLCVHQLNCGTMYCAFWTAPQIE